MAFHTVDTVDARDTDKVRTSTHVSFASPTLPKKGGVPASATLRLRTPAPDHALAYHNLAIYAIIMPLSSSSQSNDTVL
jgi:hypothetical protein